jgi:MFS transporter, PPP family, 3-phenylpropionic acid transporter
MQRQAASARPSDDPCAGAAGATGHRARRFGVRLSALQAANFAGLGIYMPFMPPWLAAQGLSERQIGLVLAMGMIIRMLASQPVASLGDSKRGAVPVLVALHFFGGLSFLSLTVMPSASAIIAAMAVIALMSSGVIPLGDHLTTAQARLTPALDFSRIRLWGSVAFLIVSVSSGFAVAHLGIASVPLMLAACSFAAMLVALAAPRHAGETPFRDISVISDEGSGQRATLLWLVIVASGLINASHAALYAFGTLHWRATGIDDSTIGMLWASAVVAEIAMFWWYGRKASASWNAALLFLAISGAAAVLRFALMPFALSLPAILALQMLHALSFGAQLMGIMAAVTMLAPEGRRALIMGRLSAVNACIMGAATLGSGFLYERLGALAFFAMVPVAMAGLGLLAVTFRLGHNLPLDSTSPGTVPLLPSVHHDGAP